MSSIFGWSYPPGCNGTPYDHDNGEEALGDLIYDILIDAGLDANAPSTADAMKKLSKLAGDAYGTGYQQGVDDASVAIAEAGQ